MRRLLLLGLLVAGVGFDLRGDGRSITEAPGKAAIEGPTIKQFPVELLQNFRHLFAGENLAPLLAGTAAAAAAAPVDGHAARWFLGTERMKELGGAGHVAGRHVLILPAVTGLLLMSRGSSDQRFRDMSYDLAQAVTLNMAITNAAKAMVRRERPDGHNRMSFYSGHSSNAFAMATVIGSHYGKPAAILSYSLAGLIAASRVEKNQHYLTDVIIGAAAGYIVGRTVTRRHGGIGRRFQLDVAPAPGGGVAFQVAIPFGRGR